jgi:NAD+--asparagine ADP-ribosyltransferase
LTFLTNMSEKRKSTSPSAIQVKNWWKTIIVKGK